MTNLDLFRKDYLDANTWAQRKDGVPLHLLDHLSYEERQIAEVELNHALNRHDDWAVIGLGHIKSKDALPVLSRLLPESNGAMKVKIAWAIFQISEDNTMKEIVLQAMPQIEDTFELIDSLYYLPLFTDARITDLLNGFRSHENYLVAYNATRHLGRSTDKIVEEFKDQAKAKGV